MTPTPMPRDWGRVDAALAGVVAFPEVDRLVGRVAETHPLHAAEARQLTAEAPKHRSDAKRRLRQVRDLRELAEVAFGAAHGEYAEARAERRQLRRRVFWLRVRLAWFRVLRPVLWAGWWLLMALPRFFRWVARLVSILFRRPQDRYRDGDDFGSRRRVR